MDQNLFNMHSSNIKIHIKIMTARGCLMKIMSNFLFFFSLCGFLDGYNEKDVSTLFGNLAGNFVGLRKDSVKAYCDIMTNESIPNSVSIVIIVVFCDFSIKKI